MCWRSVRLEIRAMTAGDYTSAERFCLMTRSRVLDGSHRETALSRKGSWLVAGVARRLARTPPTILLDSLGESR